MSHEIETMAYYGQLPWHGLGVKLDGLASGSEMLRAAGLDWRVEKREAGSRRTDGTFEPVSNSHFIVRDTDQRVLSCRSVSDEFAPLQNSDMFGAFGDDLRWETAGSLRGGCRVWGLAPTAGSFEAKSGDKLLPYLLVYNGHDGTSSLRVRFTSVRVVCANTASFALGEKGEAVHEVSVRHSGDMGAKLEEVARLMKLAAESFESQAQIAQALARAPMTQNDAAAFFAQMLTGEDDVTEAAKKFKYAEGRVASRYGHQNAVLMDLFNAGKGNVGETRWDAINAITEYVDHQRSRMGNWRKSTSVLTDAGLDSALFGTGAGRKVRALKLLTR